MRNGKKEALMEQRYTEIERENRILLEKMSNIMQSNKPSLYKPPSAISKKSLNREKRRRELVKITIENQAFLKRL
jgi:E3 ubiquitin-protein ligase TRIP12